MSKPIPWETEAKVIKLYRTTNSNASEIAAILSLSPGQTSKILKRNLPGNEYEALKKNRKRPRRKHGDLLLNQGFRECRVCRKTLDLVEFQCGSGINTCCRACRSSRTKELYRVRRQTVQWRYYTYKKDAEIRKLDFDLTEDDFMYFWNNPCYYCDKIIDTIGLDRLDNDLGYTFSNVVPCCKECNYIKKKMNYRDFIDYCRKVVELDSSRNGIDSCSCHPDLQVSEEIQ